MYPVPFGRSAAPSTDQPVNSLGDTGAATDDDDDDTRVTWSLSETAMPD